MSNIMLTSAGLVMLSSGGVVALTGGGGGGGAPANLTIPTGYTDALTVTPSIEGRHTLSVAPDPVQFTVSVSGQSSSATIGSDGYDQRLHRIQAIWKFNDSYTLQHVDRLDAAYKDTDYSFCWDTQHVFRTPGTYTVECLLLEEESKLAGIGTIEVIVQDPDTVYSGIDTIFVSTSGTFTGAPSGCQQVTSSNANSVWNTYVQGQATPKRIIFRDDETFTAIDCSTPLGAQNGRPFPSVQINRSDTGTNAPIWNLVNNAGLTFDDRTGNVTKTFSLSGLDIRVPSPNTYDDTSEAGPAGGSGLLRPIFTNNADVFLIDDVTLDGCNSLFSCPSGQSNAMAVILNDIGMTNFPFGGLIDAGSQLRFYCRGLGIKRDADAILNNVDASGWIWRVTCAKFVDENFDYFVDAGWSALGPYFSMQPSWRIQANNNVSSHGDRYWISGGLAEGGAQSIETKDANGVVTKALNGILQLSTLHGSIQTRSLMLLSQGGWTIRNNKWKMPNLIGKLGDDFQSFIYAQSPTGTSSEALAAPIEVYSNSCINDMDSSLNSFGFSGQPVVFENSSGFTDVTVENNIEYHARTGTPDTSDGPLERTSNDYSLIDAGYIDKAANNGDLTGTYAYNIAAGELDSDTPLTGAGAIAGATTGLVAAISRNNPTEARTETMSGLTRTAETIGCDEVALES